MMMTQFPIELETELTELPSSSHKVFREHKAPVLSIALDPKEQFTASSSCDGTVRVWRLDDQSEVKVFSVLSKCSDIRHAAAGCVDGSIVIFDWQLHNVVEKHRHEKGFTLTALAWNPSNSHQIAFCDKEENQVISESVMEGVFDDDDDMLIEASSKVVNDDGDDSDDDTGSIDLGAIKKRLMPMITGDEDSNAAATLPRPAVTVLPFHLPLCDSGVEKSQYEEEYLRSMLFAQHLVRWAAEGYEVDEAVQQDLTRQQQTALMKLFALSARSEREFRAMEVCELMPDEHTLQLSIKYATRLKHMQLAQRISQLIHQREQEAQMAAGGEEEEEEDFRVSSQQKDSGAPTRGSQVFDGMKKMKERGTVITPLPVSVKQTKSGQRKITVKVQFAFDLWMAENLGELEEEHPDKSERS
nr:hypothetical protein BaRGS_031171 [Batillaria attramentaria]